MNIDFTKKYYKKDSVRGYIADGCSEFFPKKQKIISMKTIFELEDYPRSMFSINELITEDDLEDFMQKVLAEQKERSEEIKNK